MKLTLTFLDRTHLDQILDLQELIINSAGNMLAGEDREWFESVLRGQTGNAVGILNEDEKVIACRFVFFPSKSEEENLGPDVGVSEDELYQVAHFAVAMVHPDFRGKSLAYQMNKTAWDNLERLGEHNHLCVTVHPENGANVKTLLKSGMVIKNLKKKSYGPRYVCYRNLHTNFRIDTRKIELVSNQDWEGQKELLENGYVGFKVPRPKTKKNGEYTIGYAKLRFKSRL